MTSKESRGVTGPVIQLKPGRDKSLRRHHPWVFSGAIARVQGDPAPGATVKVTAADGAFLARAAFSPGSQIRARVWSFDETTAVDEGFFDRRIAAAIARRRSLGWLDGPTCRLVFSEADGLPGLIVDRYGDWLACQFLSAGSEAWREVLVRQLVSQMSPRGVLERSDADMRRKEGLPPGDGLVAGVEPPESFELEIDGLRQVFRLGAGQKTGAYLDQRENRRRTAVHADGARVLDAYCYTGGFGMACLQSGARHVTFLDSSAPALDAAMSAAAINGFGDRCEAVKGDVAKTLRALQAAGERFDLIVLDPPKFVRNAEQVTKGCRAYKDINRLAFGLLDEGGILATFSCSGHVDAGLLQKVIAQAAMEAGRGVQIVERLGQPADHPVALSFPEGEYLKGFLLRVSDAGNRS